MQVKKKKAETHIIRFLRSLCSEKCNVTRIESGLHSTTNNIPVLNTSLPTPRVITIIKSTWTFLSNVRDGHVRARGICLSRLDVFSKMRMIPQSIMGKRINFDASNNIHVKFYILIFYIFLTVTNVINFRDLKENIKPTQNI